MIAALEGKHDEVIHHTYRVVDSGFGAFAPKDSDLLDEVRVLAEGGPTWREMSRKAEELSHPYASSDIARECLLLAARYKASAQASR